jgi:hypothetical protein
MSWYPCDRFSPGDGDDQPIEEPGRIRLWWWRHFNAYIGPFPVPHWLYFLTPDWIHRRAGSLEEKMWKKGLLDDGDD